MNWINSPFIVPLGAFVMTIVIVAMAMYRKVREKELEAHRELRMREMDHERQLKQMEIEKAKIELEKTKAGNPSS